MANDVRVVHEITAIVDSMGGWDPVNMVYKMNPDTDACLIELMKILRKDRANFPSFRHLGRLNILEKDLIPLIKNHFTKDEEMANNLVRFLVMLTYPALVFFKEKAPENADQKRIFLEIVGYLRLYRVVFSQNPEVLKILGDKSRSIASKEPIDQTEEEKIFLERVLILIRNILNIPMDFSGLNEDEIVAEDLIISLSESGILNMILDFSSDSVSNAFCFHLLEIIYHLLRNHSPEFIASSQSRSQHIAKKLKSELELIKEKERKAKNSVKLSRFNRFKESTYVVQNMASIGENNLIYHKTPNDPNTISLDREKAGVKKARNRAPMQDYTTIQTTNSGDNFYQPSSRVHKILKDFCENFLQKSYNSLMAYVKNALENKNGQENDETYYFFAAHFFMEFNRLSEGEITSVEETFNFEYFHNLHTKVELFLDKIADARADREGVKSWSRRCHTALKAYKELLFTVASPKVFKDDRMLEIKREMTNRVFNEFDYRELLLCLITGYDEKKMSPNFLQDLIETNHIFLKMMERLTNSADSIVPKYCSSKVVRVYSLAFKRFKTNSETLNHAIIRMFHRIACDYKSSVHFFQLSIFRIFQQCFQANKIENSNILSEINSFARFIIREFVKLVPKNDKLLVEILFWKNKRDVHDIDENYAPPEAKEPKKRKAKGERKPRKKKKKGFINDSEGSEDEILGELGDRMEPEKPANAFDDLSDDEGFIPQLSSTQKVQPEKELEDLPATLSAHSEKEPESELTEKEPEALPDEEEGDSYYQKLIGDNPDDIPSETGSFGSLADDDEDDELLDMDEVLNRVADGDDDSVGSNPATPDDTIAPIAEENSVNQENTVITKTAEPVNIPSEAADEEMEGEVTFINRKAKRIILDDSDDE